jgi:hypothetical protein
MLEAPLIHVCVWKIFFHVQNEQNFLQMIKTLLSGAPLFVLVSSFVQRKLMCSQFFLYTCYSSWILTFFSVIDLEVLTYCFLYISCVCVSLSDLKFYFIFITVLLLYRWYIVTFTKVLPIYLYQIHSHSSPLSLSSTPSPKAFLEQFQQLLFFNFHTWVHKISTIFTLLLYTPHLYQPPGRTCFTSLSLIFEKRHFCLF